jgi:hypothetical protein
VILVMYSRRDGISSIRFWEHSFGLQLRAPRYGATYSERNGFVKLLEIAGQVQIGRQMAIEWVASELAQRELANRPGGPGNQAKELKNET